MGRLGVVGVRPIGHFGSFRWSCGTALAVGCASATSGGAGGTVPASAVGGAEVNEEASGGCQVLGDHAALNDVAVTVGPQTLSLRLEDARVRVLPTPGRALAELRVEAPLLFVTSYPLRGLDVRTTRAVTLGEGRISVGRGVKPSVVGVRGDALVVSLATDLGLEVEPPPELSCSALTLAPRGAPRETPAREELPGARFASFGPAAMALHAAAGSGAAWSIRYAGPVELVGSAGGWHHVRARWEDGSALDGWTPSPPLAGEVVWPSVHVGGMSLPGGCHAADVPPTRKVLARAGAPVSATAGGAAWARFAAPTWVEAQGSAADGWLSITAPPGVAVDTCEHWFWLRAADVSEAPSP